MRIAEELADVREPAGVGGRSTIPSRVDTILAKTVNRSWPWARFSACTEDKGIVLAWEIARILAHAGKGIVRDDDGKWSLIGKLGGFEHL